jgi:hypothetical protein
MTTAKEKAKFGTELTYNTAAGSGAYQTLSGVLNQNPSIIIFDNQSNVAVIISDDGVTPGKTFSAGEALVLDMRSNAPFPACDFTWPIGTQFWANSAAGVGIFRISIVYAR